YSPARKDEAYRALLERAATALAHGETVVLDASWASEAWRDEAAQAAGRAHADLVELACTTPREVSEERLRRRMALRGGPEADAADATPEVAAVMARHTDPWPAAVEVDSSSTPEYALEQAVAAVRRCEVLHTG